MPRNLCLSGSPTKRDANKKSGKKTVIQKQAAIDGKSKNVKNTELEVEETAYERLKRKLDENKNERAKATTKKKLPKISETLATPKRRSKTSKLIEVAKFVEDDTIMEIEVGDQQDEFPSPSEEEDEDEDGEILDAASSKNNNAVVHGATGSQSATVSPERQLPSFLDEGPGTSGCQTKAGNNEQLFKTVALMQSFMVKKGILNSSMSTEELEKFIEESGDIECANMNESRQKKAERGPPKSKVVEACTNKDRRGKVQDNLSVSMGIPCLPSSSEATIYKRAIQQIAPELEEQIDTFINNARRQSQDRECEGMGKKADVSNRKISTSSEEFMDTSDELEGGNVNNVENPLQISFFAEN